MEMSKRPKRKLPLYIPRIMSDLMWATTKDSTSVHFGFGHRCHKHGRMFNLEHIQTCSEIKDCRDIAKFAQMLKGDVNIRQWDQEVLADAILQYTQLALQLANLTAKGLAALVHTPTKKKVPTGGKRGRPTLAEVILRTNYKVSDYYKKAQGPTAVSTQQEGTRSKKQRQQPAEKKKE